MAGELSFGLAGMGWKAIKKPIYRLASDLTVSGRVLKKSLANRLVKQASERSEKFLRDVAPDMVKKQVVDMDDLGLMLKSATDENRAVYNLYEELLDASAKETGGLVSMPNTMAFIERVRKQANDQLGGVASRLQINARTRRILGFSTTSDFNDVLETLKPLGTKSYLKESIEVTPKQAKNLLATVFKSGKKGFHQLPSEQMKAFREELKTSLLDDLKGLKTPSGQRSALEVKAQADETFKAIKKFDMIKNFYSQATDENPATGQIKIQSYKLAKVIKANEKTIRRDLGDEFWTTINKEADHYAQVADKLGDSGVGDTWALMPGSLTAAAGYFGGPGAAAGAELFGAASAWALMSTGEKGLVRKGFEKALYKVPIHMGVPPAMEMMQGH